MKVDRKIYKGIEFIQLEDLPVSQQEKMLQSINQELFIKIMIDGRIVGQCLQYKDYSQWYDALYVTHPVAREITVQKSFRISGDLALDKF